MRFTGRPPKLEPWHMFVPGPLTFAQMAELLGTSRANVMRIEKRALGKLVREMRKRGMDGEQ